MDGGHKSEELVSEGQEESYRRVVLQSLKALALNSVAKNIDALQNRLIADLPDELWEPLFNARFPPKDGVAESVTDEMLLPFFNHKIRKLSLWSFTSVSDTVFGEIPKRCANLRSLVLVSCPISSTTLGQIIAGCPKLEECKIVELEELTDVEVRKLASLKELHLLDVSINHRITWTAIAETVLQLPKLAGLGVSNVTEEEVQKKSEATLDSFAKLLQCTWLTSIDISLNHQIGEDFLLPFNTNKFPYMRKLNLSGIKYGRADFEAIVNGCPNLEKLDLTANRKQRNDGIIKLGHSESKLSVLKMRLVQKLADSGLMALAACPSLKKVYMGSSQSKITEKGLSAFAQGRSASTLRRLQILGTKRIGEEGFIAVAAHCTNLRDLRLENCPGVTDEVLKTIAKHNTVIHSLRMFPKESFDWKEDEMTTRVTDEGIEALVLSRKDALLRTSLPQGTTDRGVRLVVEKCPNLLELEVWSSLITDEGCQPIMQLRNLKKLSLGPTLKISNDAIFALIRALRTVDFFYVQCFKGTNEEQDELCFAAGKLAGPDVTVSQW